MKYSGWELSFFDISKNFRDYQYQFIKRYIKDNILEVGPGNGTLAANYLAKSFSNISVSEIDQQLNKKLVKKFKNKKNIKVYKKKINKFTNKFNTIIYSDVVEHIKEDQREISSAISKLKKNGHLIIMVPAFQHLYSDYDKSIGHFRRYEKKHFLKYAKKNKVKCEKIIYFDLIGYFFLILSKLINNKNKKNVGVATVIWNILIPVSRILDKIINHSIGKSLLCVYKK
jgi:SAM-dependent methyltransferase